MSSSTNSILRYVRPRPVWLCPDCDAENELTENSCFLCGCGKTVSAVIVKPIDNFDYMETDTVETKKSKKASSVAADVSTTTSTTPIYTSTPVYSPAHEPIGGLEEPEYEIPEEKKRNVVATVLIALLITIGIVLLGVLLYIGTGYDKSSGENTYFDEQLVAEFSSDSLLIENDIYSEII